MDTRVMLASKGTIATMTIASLPVTRSKVLWRRTELACACAEAGPVAPLGTIAPMVFATALASIAKTKRHVLRGCTASTTPRLMNWLAITLAFPIVTKSQVQIRLTTHASAVRRVPRERMLPNVPSLADEWGVGNFSPHVLRTHFWLCLGCLT